MIEMIRANLLIVDDTPDTLELVKAKFEDTKINVKGLESGERLHETLQTFKPDILLLDRMLPGKDGIELCKEIREYDLNTIIIFCSALNKLKNQEEGYAAGAQDYLPKPYSMVVLQKKVEEWLIKLQQHKDLGYRVAYLLMVSNRISYALESCQRVLDSNDLPEHLRNDLNEAIKLMNIIKRVHKKATFRKIPGFDITPDEIIKKKKG